LTNVSLRSALHGGLLAKQLAGVARDAWFDGHLLQK
jgi:hypothetical protein